MFGASFAIDNSLLSIALPTLSRDIHASTSDLQWIVDAYILVSAGLLLTGGNLADRYGRVGVYRIGLCVYGMASLMGAYAGNPSVLILSRGLKGIGSALAAPAGMAILSNVHADAKRRARSLGLWTSVTSLGIGLGPIIGGFLLAHFWWGSLFLFSVPLMAVALLGSFFVQSEDQAAPTGPIDFRGVVLSIAAMVTFVGTMIRAPDRGWGSPSTIGGFVLALGLASAFVAWELRCPHPMLELRFFRNQRFSVANAATAASNLGYLGSVFVIVQFLQIVQGYSALQTGVRMLPLAGAQILASVASPRLVDRAGTTRLVCGGLVVFAAGLVVMSRLGAGSSYALVVLAVVLIGGGVGMLLPPAFDSAMGAVPREQAGMASGTASTTRQSGGATGVAVFGSALSGGYRAAIGGVAVVAGLSASQLARAREAPARAFAVAGELPARAAHALRAAAFDGFVSGMHTGMLIGAGLLLLCAALTARFLPSHVADDSPPLSTVRVVPTEEPASA
jgi:EmrB/QacA subfamily drug resistance transporter